MMQLNESLKHIEGEDKSKIKKLERSIRTFEIEKEQLFKVCKHFFIVLYIFIKCLFINIANCSSTRNI